MGTRGGQPGNNNAGNGQKAKQALEMAILHNGEDREVVAGMQILYDIWKVQVLKAMDGDQAATNAIMDRLDGKPAQSIAVEADIVTTEKKLTAKEIALLAKELDADC